MALSGVYLAIMVRHVLLPMIRAYRSCLTGNILPVFEDLDRRADEVATAAYHDGADDEAAESSGQAFYDTMVGMRQATLNLFTTGLFHLLEQKLAQLGEDATLGAMGVPPAKVRLDLIQEWFQHYLDVDITTLAQWDKVHELHHLANAVKHGAGPSADTIRELRPDLFEDPRLKALWSGYGPVDKPLRIPLAGENLFVTQTDFAEFANAAIVLLESLAAYFEANGDNAYPVRLARPRSNPSRRRRRGS